MTDDPDRAYFGAELDPDKLADALEQYADRLRNKGGLLQGLSIEHEADYQEWPTVAVTIRAAAHPNPLFDFGFYSDRGDGDD